MIWLAWKLVTLPVRIVVLALRIVTGIVSKVGVSRILAFGAGVGVGMTITDEQVEEVRARVLSATGGAPADTGGVDLAASVRTELAQSPRTWHLDQPEVSAAGDRITLTGTVPHSEARHDLGRVAGSVLGVRAVENHITVDD